MYFSLPHLSAQFSVVNILFQCKFKNIQLYNLVSKIYAHWPEGLVIQKINFEPCWENQ